MFSIIFGTFFGALGVTVLILVGILMYRLIFRTFPAISSDASSRKLANLQEEKEEKIEYRWIYPSMAVVSIAIGLWKIKFLGDALFSAIMLPTLFGAWFVIHFHHQTKKTDVTFKDILRHPLQNFGMFSFLIFLVLICIIFLFPLIILNLG